MKLPKTNIQARLVIKKASIQIINRLLQYYSEQNSELAPHRNTVYWDCKRLLQIYRCSPETPVYVKYEMYLPTTTPYDVYDTAMGLIKDRSLDTAINQALKHFDL